VEFPLKIFRVVFHSQKPEQVEHMFEKSSGSGPLGAGIEILDRQKDDPHEFAVDEGQGQGKQKNDQFVHLEPEDLERLGQVLRKALAEIVGGHSGFSLI
jgi:hypothetical protein